jgi:hypothetical protein
MTPPFYTGWHRRGVLGWPAMWLCLVTLTGCGGPSHRPAAELSERERAVLADYEQIRAGLAQDDAPAARSGAFTLLATLKAGQPDPATKQLIAQTQALLAARALDIERQAFAPLSASLLPVARGVDGYYIMTSPPGMGADWIQRTPEVDNPYMGKVMHSTGTLQK